MISNPVIFYIASSIILVFALISMFAKNIICSLLAAIMVFFSASIFFFVLGSEYNAIIQMAIYGLAVPIIIGISIMFLSKSNDSNKIFTLPYLAVLSSIIFALGIVYTIMISLSMLPDSFVLTKVSEASHFEVLSAFAKGIFINYIWAFELISLLLTIVIAGVSIFRRERIK